MTYIFLGLGYVEIRIFRTYDTHISSRHFYGKIHILYLYVYDKM